jgi:hypothetical protein
MAVQIILLTPLTRKKSIIQKLNARRQNGWLKEQFRFSRIRFMNPAT